MSWYLGMSQPVARLACEPCRQRKCKASVFPIQACFCDRTLPSCSKCQGAPQQCYYSEANKRGLPPGYLAGIELRLNETEIALHRALSRLYNHSDARFQESREFPQASKGELMEQWQELPLGSDIDLETWWSRKTKYVEPLDREWGPPEETSTPETHIAHGIDDIPSVDWEPTNERHRNIPDGTDSLTRETMASTVASLPRPPNSVELQKSPVDPQLQFESDIPDSSSWQRNSQMHNIGETITVAESFARAHHKTYF
ncbi:putative zn 2cys6 transcription factor protein [Botrytis fragariae]|uniref:Putative zn 2cys6 transcription factor protein n=1 Tax=Botrytis fragariae TaxID=1964551 RepID=A0A8H6EI71_9HELO|nr:putative zn 2cys6 transcription factor protein [Botrytis fragariae]KAF5873182.1 putative zn 2cys6 transcription factor protein [Botrytis fragariae]